MAFFYAAFTLYFYHIEHLISVALGALSTFVHLCHLTIRALFDNTHDEVKTWLELLTPDVRESRR